MKKLIFVFVFLFNVAFAASGNSNLVVETAKKELNQKNAFLSYEVSVVEYPNGGRYSCKATIYIANREFSGYGEDCQTAFDNAMELVYDWAVNGDY